MSASRLRRTLRSALAGALVLLALPAAAQTWPTKPVKIVVPYSPGGTDLEVRALSGVLEKELGQPIQIEVREGGGSTIGNAYVAKSAPDGYTLLYVNSTGVMVLPQMRKLPYTTEDFRPVAQITSNAHLLGVRAGLPYKTAKELVAYAKANPGQVIFASTGSGTGAHLATELFFDAAGMTVNHIPFNGIGAAVTAVIGGNGDMTVGYPIAIMPQVTAGKMVPTVILNSKPSPLLPGIPTAKELGIDVVVDIQTGIFAPAKTPDAVVDKLEKALKVATESAEFKDFAAKNWIEPMYKDKAAFAAAIAPQKTMYEKVIARLGTK